VGETGIGAEEGGEEEEEGCEREEKEGGMDLFEHFPEKLKPESAVVIPQSNWSSSWNLEGEARKSQCCNSRSYTTLQLKPRRTLYTTSIPFLHTPTLHVRHLTLLPNDLDPTLL
jgi:hypothetical protein